MSGRVIARPEMTEDTGLAEAREQFLTGELIGPGRVRDTILASWWRSREWNVAADRIDLSYVRDPDLDTPLTAAPCRCCGTCGTISRASRSASC
jgi:hypothetical protein